MKVTISKEGLDFIKRAAREIQREKEIEENEKQQEKEEREQREAEAHAVFRIRSSRGLAKTIKKLKSEEKLPPLNLPTVVKMKGLRGSFSSRPESISSGALSKDALLDKGYLKRNLSSYKRIKTEPARTDNYSVFKESFESFRSSFKSSKFLKFKMGGLLDKARKKRRLGMIEKNISDKRLNSTRASNSEQIISIGKSVAFFEKSVMQDKINFHEFNTEIREIQELKKLKLTHHNVDKAYKQRMGKIRRSFVQKLNRVKDANAEAIMDKLKSTDLEMKKLMTKGKSSKPHIKVVLSNEKVVGGSSQPIQDGIGHIRFKKEELIGNELEFSLPKCFRNRRRFQKKRPNVILNPQNNPLSYSNYLKTRSLSKTKKEAMKLQTETDLPSKRKVVNQTSLKVD